MKDEIQDTQMQVMHFASMMIDRGVAPFAIAASFAQLAFMIYKTSLTEEDYQQMIHTIYESRDRVPRLDTQSNLH